MKNENSEKQSHHRRQKLLINQAFQFSFLGFTTAIAFFAIGAFYVSNRYFLSQLAQAAQKAGLGEGHALLRLLEDQGPVLDLYFVVGSIASFLTIFVGGLWLSHRVAGPLEKLNKHMSELAKTGDSTPLQFRKTDYFNDLAETFNLLLRKKK